MKAKKLVTNTENMKRRKCHIMTTELCLNEMPVRTIKIYFECKKKIVIHAST